MDENDNKTTEHITEQEIEETADKTVENIEEATNEVVDNIEDGKLEQEQLNTWIQEVNNNLQKLTEQLTLLTTQKEQNASQLISQEQRKILVVENPSDVEGVDQKAAETTPSNSRKPRKRKLQLIKKK